MQLYRCEWLNDLQRSNVLLALNAMAEKSSFMGVTDLPMIRSIEALPLEPGEQPKTKKSLIRASTIHPSDLSATAIFNIESDSSYMNMFPRTSIIAFDSKHDTRIVNEAFQVSLETRNKHERKQSIKLKTRFLGRGDVIRGRLRFENASRDVSSRRRLA